MSAHQTVFYLRRNLHYTTQWVSPYGDCVVVPQKEFDKQWAVSLENQGHRCIAKKIGDKDFVLVKLAIGDPKTITVAEAPGVVIGSTSEKKTPIKEMFPPKTNVAKAKEVASQPEPAPVVKKLKKQHEPRVNYTSEEDNYLIELYKQTPELSQDAISAKFRERFPKRKEHSGANRIQKLLKDPQYNLQPRGHENHGNAVDHTADPLIIELWQKGKTVHEIEDAVKQKYPDKAVNVASRISSLQQQGSIKQRQVHGKTRILVKDVPEINSAKSSEGTEIVLKKRSTEDTVQQLVIDVSILKVLDAQREKQIAAMEKQLTTLDNRTKVSPP